MTGEELTMILRQRWFSVRAEGENLICIGVPGALDQNLQDSLLKYKAQVLSFLKKEDWVAKLTSSTLHPVIDFTRQPPELRIQQKCHPRFRYWQKGQTLYATLVELDAPLEIFPRYVHNWERVKNGRE